MEEIDLENLDLKSMTPEEIVSLEKEYLVNVLGKKLIDSEERDNRRDGHRRLAKKYWPEEFEGEEKKCVHHIDFNHSNNIVSNLVVLTYKEHKLIHNMFDPDYEGKTRAEETKKKISESTKGKPKGPCSEEHKKKISETLKRKLLHGDLYRDSTGKFASRPTDKTFT